MSTTLVEKEIEVEVLDLIDIIVSREEKIQHYNGGLIALWIAQGKDLLATGKSSRELEAETGISKTVVADYIKMSKDDRLVRHIGQVDTFIQKDLIALTKLDDEDFIEVLELGSVKEWKKQQREDDIQQQREDIENGVAVLPEGKYEVIAIDPPWNYGREYDPETSRVANPYPEMEQWELLDLKIPSADDSVMFLWTTHAFIFDAKELLDEWGFEYKATMVWNKEKIGMGHWLRMQCEFCLVGIKGNPTWDNTTWRDIITESRREHSRKPETFYQMVEEVTVGRRLEYFSRTARNGWEIFGNDVGRLS